MNTKQRYIKGKVVCITYQCEYCNLWYESEAEAKAHEIACRYNPVNKECASCLHARYNENWKYFMDCRDRLWNRSEGKGPCDEWKKFK